MLYEKQRASARCFSPSASRAIGTLGSFPVLSRYTARSHCRRLLGPMPQSHYSVDMLFLPIRHKSGSRPHAASLFHRRGCKE